MIAGGGNGPTVAFFPEASFGAALNCVGIARELQARGAHPVFICHAGFSGVFADYGFQEYALPAGPGDAAGGQNYWQAFIRRHLPHFDLPPAEQIETYVAPTWEAIVDTAIRAEAPLAALLRRLSPDLIVLDNVVMFPAVARAGCPWVRVISCAETELPDPLVPPYLSGLAAEDETACRAFERRYLAAVGPVHARYNRFRADCGLPALPAAQFLEPSDTLNLVLCPSIVRRARAAALDPRRYGFLEGCVRRESAYTPPPFSRDTGPLVYVSFGSLGATDIGLFERLFPVFARLDARFLVNVGGFRDAYRAVPDNVHLDSWFPQPSVVGMADLFIHHGGNNSFCEALYFGVPSLILPYCWDGHDNARRAEETGTGQRLERGGWSAEALEQAVRGLLADLPMRQRLQANARRMAADPGVAKAAALILDSIPAAAGVTAAQHRPGRR